MNPRFCRQASLGNGEKAPCASKFLSEDVRIKKAYLGA